MKVDYTYLNKLKELGEKNVTKEDIESVYIDLIMDVIATANKKHRRDKRMLR